jgi:glycosyltransferase involved in cell wall biosynthesis
MSSDIRFSVVIPAYNAAVTIGKTIESCLGQSYAAHEIIVVDDASTDNTEEAVKQYAGRIKYIKLLTNTGSATARNKGMGMATGDHIAFLDADDIWHENKLGICASVLSGVPGISLLYHSYTLNDIHTVTIPEGATLYRTPFVKLLQRNLVATPCAVIKNEKKYEFNTDMRYSEDYDLWLRMAYKHKAYFIDIPLTQLGRPLLSEGGVSANKWAMRKGEMRAFTRLVRLNPLFLFSLPFLYSYSLGKHIFKAISGR